MLFNPDIVEITICMYRKESQFVLISQSSKSRFFTESFASNLSAKTFISAVFNTHVFPCIFILNSYLTIWMALCSTWISYAQCLSEAQLYYMVEYFKEEDDL